MDEYIELKGEYKVVKKKFKQMRNDASKQQEKE